MDTDRFKNELTKLLSDAKKAGKSSLIVEAGDLHRMVGGYPGPEHRMPTCCSGMRQRMGTGDRILKEPPKGKGATLTIEYFLNTH